MKILSAGDKFGNSVHYGILMGGYEQIVLLLINDNLKRIKVCNQSWKPVPEFL